MNLGLSGLEYPELTLSLLFDTTETDRSFSYFSRFARLMYSIRLLPTSCLDLINTEELGDSLIDKLSKLLGSLYLLNFGFGIRDCVTIGGSGLSGISGVREV